MSDAQINPDDPQGQNHRSGEWTGRAGAADLGPAGFDALDGTGEPESSWLLEDDDFDPVVSSEQAETEPVQPLPTELDALQEQAVAPTWSEEEALLGDDPMIGASYVEPETASSAAMRALVPAGLCMALSFGAIGLWSLVEDGPQTPPVDVTADLQVEGPVRPESEPEVDLVTPEIGNAVELGRLSYQRDGTIVPADSHGPTAARSTVDPPREPGELPPTLEVAKDARAASVLEGRSTGLTDFTAGSIQKAAGVMVTTEHASTSDGTGAAADPQGAEVGELTEKDLATEGAPDPGDAPTGEGVAFAGDAPTTSGFPGSSTSGVEPPVDATLSGADASSDDAGDTTPPRTNEVAQIEPDLAPEEFGVAPLPGDEGPSASGLRFPGPGFCPAGPVAPDLLSEAPPAPEAAEDAGPAAAVLPFGFFDHDVTASVDVDPELAEVEFEITAPEPGGVAETGASEPVELDDAMSVAANESPVGEELFVEPGLATAAWFAAPWIPLEIVMDSFDGERSFAAIGEETIDDDLEFDDDEGFPAPVTVEIVVHEAGESGDPTARGTDESFDEAEVPFEEALAFEDDGEFPAAVTVEIVVLLEDDVPIAEEVEGAVSAVTETAAERIAVDSSDRCRGEAVAHDRLDAIFGPALRETATGESLVSEILPAPVTERPGADAAAVDRPTAEFPAGAATIADGDTAASIDEEVEVEVLPGVAGAAGTPRFRGVVRRFSTGNIWPHSTVPESKIGMDAFVLTPNVGDVRVVFDGDQTIDGRLHGVGQNRIVLDTRLGRLTIDGRRASRIDRFARKNERPSTGVVNTKGLDLVRVKADGGIFQGHLLSRENGKVTLLLEQGMRITLESDEVEPAVGNGSVSRMRRDH